MIHIVENTLRDGSYVIDFQFTKEQTTSFVGALANVGFKFIEVGHGLGLGAYNNPKTGLSKETDQSYILAAKASAGSAKIGVFFIPGIGKYSDIDLAVDCGIDFIRIGTNVDEYEKANEYVEYSKKKGLFVAVNLMKSYGVKSYEFTQIAQKIDQWSLADIIYLVDSAGCMMPDEVFEYLDRTKEKISTQLGFHGHNNLSLGVANTLQAIKAGAKYIDTCIRGMGRSAGNAQTEIIVPLLQKIGISPIEASPYELYEIANRYIAPLMTLPQGLTDEEIHIGISKFHTSYLPFVDEAVSKFGVDKKLLIKKVSDINCVNPTRELFLQVAQEII